MSNATIHAHDFPQTDTSEPHTRRRKEILKKYPQIRKLFGPEPKTKYIVSLMVITQIVIAYFIKHLSIWDFLILAYFVGGVINHSLTLAIHEVGHNLAFQKPAHNKIFSIIANLPLGLPSAITFRRYHAEHHRYLGIHYKDVDIPTRKEAILFNTPFKKIIWLLLQPLFYALRPLFIARKNISFWEIMNFATQLIFDALVVYFIGWEGLIYLLASTFLGMGLHPISGHFISEHYLFDNDEQETYSYYGLLNKLTFNVGYHNEHHDFPYIPWSRLKELRKIAPEYYNDLGIHKSWVKIIYKFITDPNFNLYRRVDRAHTG